MASIVDRNGRWRALVRKAGQTRCATFGSRQAARAWATNVEQELDELRAHGVMQVKGKTLSDLIDRYKDELYRLKRWGRSKEADLARIKSDLGTLRVAELTSRVLIDHFSTRSDKGAGRVVVNSQLGYLIGVLRVARTLWHLDVPLQAAEAARTALASVGMAGKSKQRDRRVTDAELQAVIDAQGKKNTAIPMADILWFCMATAMRISEVCRIRWEDVNEAARTVVIRDRKDPKQKYGNDMTVPLLDATGYDAFEIAWRQPRTDERIFPYSEKTIGTYFTRAVSNTEIKDLHLHDLRHEAISRLFAAGYRIEQVALVSGHRDWATLKRYTHVKAEDLHPEKKPGAAP